MTENDVKMVLKYENPDFPDMEDAGPALEQWSYNQKPKGGWRNLTLKRFTGTDLYQWFGKKGEDSSARDWSVFIDSASEVFKIKERG